MRKFVSWQLFSWRAFVFVLLIISVGLSVFGQERALIHSDNIAKNTKKRVNLDTYEEVLDLLFPKTTIAPLPYGYILRFQPSFDSESQIIINNNFSDITVEEYTSPDGNIREQLDRLVTKTGNEDAEELAKQIRVQKRTVKVSSATAKRWRECFYRNLQLAGVYEGKHISEDMKEVGLGADGTSYMCWYKGKSDFSFQFNIGSEPDSAINPSDNPLVNWMKQIKREVSKLPTINK